jgi:hypothetical protein
MTQPNYGISPFASSVHGDMPSTYNWQNLSQEQLQALRKNLINSIVQVIVMAIKGVLTPGGLENTLEQLTDIFEEIPIVGDMFTFFNEFLGDLLGVDFGEDFDVFDVWSNIITTFFNPLGLLDIEGVPIIGDIIDMIWDAFDSGIFGNTSGNPISFVFDAISAIFGTGSNAQAVNVIQDVRLDALAGGTSGLSDAFDGAASSALNSTNWTQVYQLGGSGTCGLSGDGFAKWNTSGSGARISWNTYKTATTTDTQSSAISFGTNIATGSITPPTMVLVGRSDTTAANCVCAVVQNDEVEIGYIVANSYTRLGAVQALSTDTSGTWQLKLGTTASSREFVVLHMCHGYL